VEFAVIAPLFFLLIFGIVEFGRALMVVELLNSAARNGCRQAVLSGSSNSSVTAATTTTLSPAGINNPSVAIEVNGASGDVSQAASGDTITVTVSVSYSSVSWLPTNFFLGNKSLQGVAVMRRE
jgi:Flp pilus assembly protein TadG